MSSFTAEQLEEIGRLVSAATNATKESCSAEVAANAFSMDQAWLVISGALVFFMHSGFALLEVGSVSVRNVQNILFKNAISPTFAAVAFWFCGKFARPIARHHHCPLRGVTPRVCLLRLHLRVR